jgi:hypothetical protein
MTRVASLLLLLLASVALGPTRAEAKRPRAPAHPGASSFIAFHTARVKHDLMMFHPDYPGLQMALRREGGDEADAAASSFHFVSASRAADPLEVSRQRDRLLLFRPESSRGAGTALGLGLFSTMIVMSAHLPDPLRVLFDGPVHVGPAIFDDGGMGAGVAATGL